jgi:hypothetical protein
MAQPAEFTTEQHTALMHLLAELRTGGSHSEWLAVYDAARKGLWLANGGCAFTKLHTSEEQLACTARHCWIGMPSGYPGGAVECEIPGHDTRDLTKFAHSCLLCASGLCEDGSPAVTPESPTGKQPERPCTGHRIEVRDYADPPYKLCGQLDECEHRVEVCGVELECQTADCSRCNERYEYTLDHGGHPPAGGEWCGRTVCREVNCTLHRA